MTCFINKRKTHAVGPCRTHVCLPPPGPLPPPPRPPPGPAPEPRLSPHIRHALCTQSHRHTLTQAVHRPLRRHTHRARSSALPAPPCGPHTTAGEREGDGRLCHFITRVAPHCVIRQHAKETLRAPLSSTPYSPYSYMQLTQSHTHACACACACTCPRDHTACVLESTRAWSWTCDACAAA